MLYDQIEAGTGDVGRRPGRRARPSTLTALRMLGGRQLLTRTAPGAGADACRGCTARRCAGSILFTRLRRLMHRATARGGDSPA